MTASPRRDERLAELLVATALGCPVRHIDGVGAQREVDAEIDLPGGYIGALEITQMGDPKHFELIQTLEREGWEWETPGQWLWLLNIGRLAEVKRLRALAPRVVVLCESAGVLQPSDLPKAPLWTDSDVRWLAWESESRMWGLPQQVSARPRIALNTKGFGGVLPDTWDGLPAIVTGLLMSDNGESHIAKLRARGDTAERHLFLIVTGESIPHGWFFKLQRPETVPDVPVDLPVGVDALWLSVGAECSLCFRRNVGWSLHETPGEVLPEVAA